MLWWRKERHSGQDEAPRDWLSEEQWQQAIQQIRRRALDFNGPERRDRRAPRHQAITRCLLRVQRRGSVLGMLVVRSRNISSTGMCVVHGGRLPRYARATIVIEAGDGSGIITEGQVVWCRRIRGVRPAAHEIGIQFDAPVDVSPFVSPASSTSREAAA